VTDQASPPTPPDPHFVRALWKEADALIARLEGPVRRVKLGAGDYVVEIEWDTAAAGTAVIPPPPAIHSAAAVEGVELPGSEARADRHAIVAPLVGTFYRAPEPGSPPFVNVGDVVARDQPVGIVEAMKIMNRIVADREGRVAEVLVPDGQMVEFEQVLMYLEPIEGGNL
jgi:acetyl-CoA carboxylase biotin carboxyl carrier protein